MAEGYFARLVNGTSGRAWVNNPTHDEIRLALGQGAVGCTTNPAHGGGLLRRAPGEIRPVIAAVAREIPDDEPAAQEVQKRLVGRILPFFRPIFDRTAGRQGFVSLQGSPELDTHAGPILAAAEQARSLAPNCIPKIPATKPGMEAFSQLVADGQPTLMTEVFSLAQVIQVADRYMDITSHTGRRPPFIMAPITGIFGDHLRAVAAREGVQVDKVATEWAGVAFARAAAALVADRAYPVTLLFGGARVSQDLTGLVGGGHLATINWSTFEEILREDPECRETISDPTPGDLIGMLSELFEDFRDALDPKGLELDDFEAFGPVQHFRNNFLAGWQAVRDAVKTERSTGPAD
jgi:transaldolase